jgi:hypothetical protein
MNRSYYGLAAAALVLAGCHTITEELPTAPSASPKAPTSGVLKVSIPTIPTPTPTPKPTPVPTPTPAPGATPTPAPNPTPTPGPGAGGCGSPLPPPLWNINTKIHIRGPNRWTLDSTPIVHDREYCAAIGFTDGRVDCAVRTEGTPDREACEVYALGGTAADTGRNGPTWTRNGSYCSGNAGDCENHEDNQFLVYAYGGGKYQACSRNGVCGTVQVDR